MLTDKLTTNYIHVYFRIDSAYKWGSGWTNEQSEQFKEISKNLFLNDGWQLKGQRYHSSNDCNIVIKGNDCLYLHPMNFSGVVLSSSIDHIKKIISQANIFSCRSVDTYEPVYEITKDEYIKLLEERKEEILDKLIGTFKTKRSNLYIIDTYSVISNISKNYTLSYIDTNSLTNINHEGNIASTFITKLFNNLVEQRLILEADTRNGKGYRSLNAKELKAYNKLCA